MDSSTPLTSHDEMKAMRKVHETKIYRRTEERERAKERDRKKERKIGGGERKREAHRQTERQADTLVYRQTVIKI